jgi:hypothetical protein
MKYKALILLLLVSIISCKKEPVDFIPDVEDLGPKIIMVKTTLDQSGASNLISKKAEYSGDTLKRISLIEWDIFYDFVFPVKSEVNLRAFRKDSIYGPQPASKWFNANIFRSENRITQIDLNEEFCCGDESFTNHFLSYKDNKLDTTSIIYQNEEYFEYCKDMVYEDNSLVSFNRVQRGSDQALKVSISYGGIEKSSIVNTNPYNNFILATYSHIFMEFGYMFLIQGISDYLLFQREWSLTGVKSDRLITNITIKESWNPDVAYLVYDFDYERDTSGRIKKILVYFNSELFRVEEFEYE